MADAPALEHWLDWRLARRDHGPGLLLCLGAGTWLLRADLPWVAALSLFGFGLLSLWFEVVLLRRLVAAGTTPVSVQSSADAVEPGRLLALLLVAITLFALVLAVQNPALLARLKPPHPAPGRALGLCLTMLPLGWLIGRSAMALGSVTVGRWLSDPATKLVPTPDGGALVQAGFTHWKRLPDAASVERYRRADRLSRAGTYLHIVALLAFTLGLDFALVSWSWVPAVVVLMTAFTWLARRPTNRALRGSPRVVTSERGEAGMEWATYASPAHGRTLILAIIAGLFLAGLLLSTNPWMQATLGVDQRGVLLLYNAAGLGLCLGWLIALQPLGVRDRRPPPPPTRQPLPARQAPAPR